MATKYPPERERKPMKTSELPETIELHLVARRVMHTDNHSGMAGALYAVQFPHAPQGERDGHLADLLVPAEQFAKMTRDQFVELMHGKLLQELHASARGGDGRPQEQDQATGGRPADDSEPSDTEPPPPPLTEEQADAADQVVGEGGGGAT